MATIESVFGQAAGSTQALLSSRLTSISLATSPDFFLTLDTTIPAMG